MKTLLTLGLVIASLPTALQAQSYAGDYDYSVQADGHMNIPGTITTGPAFELFTDSGQRAAVGDGCSGTASTSDVTVERLAIPGRIQTASRIQGTQFIPSPCGADAGGAGRLNQGLNADDLIFRRISDPLATGAISVSLNVEFSGRAEAPQDFCGAGFVSRYTIAAGAGGSPNKILSKFGTVDNSGSYGVLVGYGNDDSIVTFTTGPIGAIDLLQPENLHLGLEVNTRAGLCEDPTPSSLNFETHAALSLPRSGPVFNLPPDVTVDSVQLGIVDNHWMGARRLYAGVSPDPVLAGMDFTLSAWNGEPRQRVAFYLVSLNGIPQRILLGAGRLDASGHCVLGPVPSMPSWAGSTGSVVAVAMDSRQQHLQFSDPVAVTFQ